MTQPNILELAKQGNAKAITILINRQLQPKGITAKAVLKEGCLQIMLESAPVPKQEVLVAFLRKGITGLEVKSIKRVKVYGRQTGEEFPAWNQEFDLEVQANLTRTNNQSSFTTLRDKTVEPKNNKIQPSIQNKTPTTPVVKLEMNLNGVNILDISKLTGIAGSLFLFVGLFTPLVTLPIRGELNYFSNSKGDGLILLLLCVTSLFFTLKEKYKYLWWTGLAALGVVFLGLIDFQMRISKVKSHLNEQLSGNPFRGLADAAVDSIHLQWGWFVLFLGAGLIITTVVIQEKEKIQQSGYIKYFSELFNFQSSKKFYYLLGAILISTIILRMLF